MVKRKSQTKSYITTLLNTGNIVSEIHYGHFSRDWWIATESSLNDQANSPRLRRYSIFAEDLQERKKR